MVFFGGYYAMKFRLFRIKYLGFALLALMGVIGLLIFKDYNIQGKFTVELLLSNFIENLKDLRPLEHIGSFNSRINAIILGTRELFGSFFFGIGPGNSLLMMSEVVQPGMDRYAALSMHNITYQIITETGIFGIITLGYFLYQIVQAANVSKISANLIWLFYLCCIISVTLLSAAWSNYFYLFILFFSLEFFKNNFGNNTYEDFFTKK
jgi:hypothetical protein